MHSTNLFIVRGYAGADAKAAGKAAKVIIATTRVWCDDKKAKVEKTDWVTVTILNGKAVAFALASVKKGDPVRAGVQNCGWFISEGWPEDLHDRHHRQHFRFAD